MISKKLASIDIGSNAIRLLICTANETKEGIVFKKNSLIRVPIRLGQDVFTEGKISEKNQKRFLEAMQGFKHLMNVHDVEDLLACATSAMRNASNSDNLIKKTKKLTGIDVKVIDGQTEAKIIYETHIEKILDKNTSYLYIDVGGGSTEITIFDGKKAIASKSFKLGTIRVLNNLVKDSMWEEFNNWIKENTKNQKNLKAIASGGNINRIFKIIGKKKWHPITLKEVLEIKKEIENISYEKRQLTFNMNPDRADVIIPALNIYTNSFVSAGIDDIFVPKIGLADGLIRKLYADNKKISFLL